MVASMLETLCIESSRAIQRQRREDVELPAWLADRFPLGVADEFTVSSIIVCLDSTCKLFRTDSSVVIVILYG